MQIRAVMASVAALHRLSLAELVARNRRQPLAAIRQAAMKAAYDRGAHPEDIAHVLKRDRSTVLHGIEVERGRSLP